MPRPENFNAVDATADLRGIVVDKADRLIGVGAVMVHIADNRLAGVSRPVNEHPAAPLVEVDELPPYPSGQSQSSEHAEHKERIDEKHGPRVGGEMEDKVDEQIERQRAGKHASHEAPKVPDARISPKPLVKAKRDERDASRQHKQRNHPKKEVP